MKMSFKQVVKPLYAVIVSAVLLCSCTATVKVPKHPAPGDPPPPPPKVEVHQNR